MNTLVSRVFVNGNSQVKNRPPEVAGRVDALAPDDTLGMSFVTQAELLKGAERRTRKFERIEGLRLAAWVGSSA